MAIETLRQRKAAEIALESIANGNTKSKAQILREAGYPESTAKIPHQVFKSEGFKNAIQELSRVLMIDKDARLLRLAQIFWEGTPAEAIKANQELSKMQGDYLPTQTEFKDLREERRDIFRVE